MSDDASGGINDDDDEKVRLSWIENSIRRIPVGRQEFEDKVGVNLFPGNVEEDAPSILLPFFKGKLATICKEEQGTGSVERRCGRKGLLAQIRKWLDKAGRKQQTGATTISSTGNSSGRYCPKEILEKYRVKFAPDGEGSDIAGHRDSLEANYEVRGSLITDKTSNALAFCNHRGVLFEGEILNHHQRGYPSADHFGRGHNKTILQCAGYLYFQLWWFRTKLKREVSKVYGFSLSGPRTLLKTDAFEVSLLMMQLPQTGPIAGRYPVYEYTRRFKLEDNSNSSNFILNELAHFLMSPDLPNPFESSISLPLTYSPGCMLLPDQFLRNTVSNTKWEVVPTTTGSLVIRCQNADTVLNLLALCNDDVQTLSMQEDFRNYIQTNVNDSKVIWYLKFKTPSFGRFWNTAEIAITATRGRLLRQKKSRTMATKQWWIKMHPVDALVTKSRSITILRSMGTVFHGQILYGDFKREFAALVQRTLDFQASSNIVHGDIYEGNVLFDKSARCGYKLALIDWDEGLRDQPCVRKIETEEERKRYPNALVNFPELYTKYQVMQLYSHFLSKNYAILHNDWLEAHKTATEGECGMLRSVEAGFKAMVRFLERA